MSHDASETSVCQLLIAQRRGHRRKPRRVSGIAPDRVFWGSSRCAEASPCFSRIVRRRQTAYTRDDLPTGELAGSMRGLGGSPSWARVLA